MTTTTAVPTTYDSQGVPVPINFTRSGGQKLLRAKGDGPHHSAAIDQLVSREAEVFAWMEASEANARLFASDPEAALRQALPDLDPAVFDELRVLGKQYAALAKGTDTKPSHTPVPMFEESNAVATASSRPLLLATSTDMKGWDMIVATRQGLINSGLKKLYTSERIRLNPDLGGFIGKLDVDVTIGPPSVSTITGGGRLARVTIPLLDGSISKPGGISISVKGASLQVTSNLLVVEATMQPRPGDGKNFDVFIDLKDKEAVYNVTLPGSSDPTSSGVVVEALKAYLLSLTVNKYRIATINLGKSVPQEILPLIPQVADFTFIKDDKNPDDTTFAALLLNDTKKARGKFEFDSIIPTGKKAAAMMSNELFVRQVLFPAVKGAILKDAHGGQEQRIVTEKDAGNTWHIRNRGDIDLKKDNDPWIENGTLDCYVADDRLKLNLEARAKKFPEPFTIRMSIRAWVGWQVVVTTTGDSQKVELVRKDYREEKNCDIGWLSWLMAFFGGVVGAIMAEILTYVIKMNIPSLGDTVFSVPMGSVSWPYVKQMKIEGVTLPSAVVIEATPKLLEA